MLKKLLTIIGLMLLISSAVFGAETGTKITRDVADFVRVLVVNENAGAGAQAGFKAMNDQSDSLMIYIEKGAAGDSWIKTSHGHLKFDIPVGKYFEWYIDDGARLKLTSSGIETGLWLGSTIAVARGGTGTETLTDGGILLGSGTNAITPMAVLGDGAIVVGDGTTDPVALTAFTSSTGDVKLEAGGLAADVSGYTGLVAITGGATAEVDSKTELEGHIADVANFAEADGDNYTGDHAWSAALIMGASPLQFEGFTDDTWQTYFHITDPTLVDKTITFQDASGTVVMDATACWDLEGTLLSITTGVLNAVIPTDHIDATLLKDDAAPQDEDIVTYEATGTTFQYHTPSELISAGTNIAWDGTTLNVAIASGDVSIGAANYLYLWATGNTQNVEADNWRCSVGANSLVWEYYTGAAWVEKEEKLP